jgi:hypothetical protein
MCPGPGNVLAFSNFKGTIWSRAGLVEQERTLGRKNLLRTLEATSSSRSPTRGRRAARSNMRSASEPSTGIDNEGARAACPLEHQPLTVGVIDEVYTADSAKVSNRYRLTAEDGYNFLGFRVARGAGEGPGGLRSSIGSH